MTAKPKSKNYDKMDSDFKQKQQNQAFSNSAIKWYQQMFKNRSQYQRAPSYLPTYKQSHPYRLIISKLQGLSLTKKNGSTDLYLSLTGMLLNQKFDIIGTPFQYQFQYSFGRIDNKWDVPVVFYFHSKIDKNYEGVYLLIKFKVIEIKENFVQNCTEIGTLIIKNPFIQEENKSASVYKDLNEVEFFSLPPEGKAKVLAVSSTINAQYTIQSMLQLKKLTKLIPENLIVSHQDKITGIYNNYLPKEINQIQLRDASSIKITIDYLQIHISQKFQNDLIQYIKKIYPNQKSMEIKNRKAILGFHNQYTLVNPFIRKLELIDKEIAGQARILIYEGLKQGEIIKLPYYSERDESCGVIAVGLVYEIGGRELELACFYIFPINNGEEISERMLVGFGYGATSSLLPFATNDIPTLIMEYKCDFKQFQESTSNNNDFIKTKETSNKKHYVDEEALAREREILKKEIENEKLMILKEKEEMEKLKMDNDYRYQAEFQKKFQIEKQNLYKRQQMIENQYKEQVERQIRGKFQLEEEIKKMNEKLRMLEENQLNKLQENSYQLSKNEYFTKEYYPQQQNVNLPPIRQRMDPGYVIQPENSIPIRKVRQIMERDPKINSQIIKQSQQLFNYASKFTFTFTSIIWSEGIEAPRSIYLVIRFFNQKELRTENIGYIQVAEGGYHKLIKLSHYIQGYETKQPTYSYVIDPSEYYQPALLQKDLTNYLANNNAIIDVFCGETHLYIGQINIKLKELLRGNKAQTLLAKQLNLVRLKDKQVYGVIQILLQNQQVNCKEEISVKYETKIKDLKRKIVSNNPIHISSQQKYSQTKIGLENQIEPIRNKRLNVNRQQLRIQKFKEQKYSNTFASTANQFSELQQSDKGLILGQIASYKQKKMEEYLKGVYEGILNEKIIISAHFGKAVTFPFIFSNTSQSPASYKVSILSVGDQNRKQLSLVKGNKQWRYLTSKYNYIEPKRFDMIGQNDNFFLHPGENVNLIFKFLSFINEAARIGQIDKKQKMINVTICKEDSNWIAGGFSLLVNMHEQIIHHSYVLYEPGDQIVDLIVPVIYSQTDNNSNPKMLYLTDNSHKSSAQWLNNYQILVRIPTPKIMQKLKFNLLLYNDEYFCELAQNWLLEINAFEGVCTTFRQDFNTKFKITLPWSTVPAHLGLLSMDKAASSLKIFSSCSGLVFKNNIIELQSDRRDQGSYQVWCELIGNDNITKNFEITCVSGDEDQLLYGWVVTVYPYLPRS